MLLVGDGDGEGVGGHGHVVKICTFVPRSWAGCVLTIDLAGDPS